MGRVKSVADILNAYIAQTDRICIHASGKEKKVSTERVRYLYRNKISNLNETDSIARFLDRHYFCRGTDMVMVEKNRTIDFIETWSLLYCPKPRQIEVITREGSHIRIKSEVNIPQRAEGVGVVTIKVLRAVLRHQINRSIQHISAC